MKGIFASEKREEWEEMKGKGRNEEMKGNFGPRKREDEEE